MTLVATIYRSIRLLYRNPNYGMVATKVTLVKSPVMEVSNDGCDWSISIVIDSNGESQYLGTTTIVTPQLEVE